MAADGVVPEKLERAIRKYIFRPIGHLFEGAHHRGAVLPGYKYLGPFNSLDKGEPVNEADAAALEHDKAYDKELQEGKNPYLHFNKADKEFMEKLKDDTSFGGNLAKAIFQGKKRLAEVAGTDDTKDEPKDAGDGKMTDYYPVKKKAKVEENSEGQNSSENTSGEGSSQDKEQDGPSDAAPGGGGGGEQAVPGGSPVMAEGAGAPMGDNNQGADGVGNSSGNWHCDSQWMGDHVVTRTTRTWVLPSYNNYLYKAIQNSDNDANNAWTGFSTPWGYFDFNRFHCHFSPRDWQRLINNNWGFRPKAMQVKIFNIQVKEVTTQDSQKSIANNLTSTVQIFADQEYLLPYVLDSATEGVMPPFPADVYQLPQYGYLTFSETDNTTKRSRFNDRSAFYCLEYFPSQMLRTGNNFELKFVFEDVPFHAGYAHCQSLDRLYNPLLDQYLWTINSINTGAPKWTKTKAPANRMKNWLPGPKIRNQKIDTTSNQNKDSNNVWSLWVNKYTLDNREVAMRPGPACASHTSNEPQNISGDNELIFSRDPYNASNELGTENVLITDETEILPTNEIGYAPWGRCANNTQNRNTDPTMQEINAMGALPGMVWQNRDVYLQGPIWAKIPDTENHFHPAPHMGGFGLKKPPPQIFVKNTQVPADPPETWRNEKWNSFINQYSTGQITVEIVWELQKEKSKRWNPEIQFTSNFGQQLPSSVPFAPNDNGAYQEPRLIGTRYLSKNL